MAKEPANFEKTATLFDKTLGNNPLGKWVKGCANDYADYLKSTPNTGFCTTEFSISFTVKRLIDVFLNTQYAHQPCAKRQRQFNECLSQIGGWHNVLTWIFLTEVWSCSLKLASAGRVIADWFRRYCEYHSVAPDVLNSLRFEHQGLGVVEKSEVRKARQFREKVEEIAMQLWIEAGKPIGGPESFRISAEQQLQEEFNWEQ